MLAEASGLELSAGFSSGAASTDVDWNKHERIPISEMPIINDACSPIENI